MDSVSRGLSPLAPDAELQRRIDQLDEIITATVQHPEWFADATGSGFWCMDEIDDLEAAQIGQMVAENEKDRLAGRLNSKDKLIVPIVPQWTREQQEEDAL